MSAWKGAVLGQRERVVDHGFCLSQRDVVDEFREERHRLRDVLRDGADGSVHCDCTNLPWMVVRIAQHFWSAIWPFVGSGQCLGVAAGHGGFGDFANNPFFQFAGRQGGRTSVIGAGRALVDGVGAFEGRSRTQCVSAVTATEEAFQRVGGLAFLSGHIDSLLRVMARMSTSSMRNDNAASALGILHVILPSVVRREWEAVRSGRKIRLRSGSSSGCVTVVICSPFGESKPRDPPSSPVSGESKTQQARGGCDK